MISKSGLNVWQLSREMSPFAEAGGVKDVVAGISKALADDHHSVTVILPMYKFLQKYKTEQTILEFDLRFGHKKEKIEIFRFYHHNIRVFFVSARCFDSKELVYTYNRNEEVLDSANVYGAGHRDCNLMNLVLQRSALETAYRMDEKPDLFHLHDGHCGFLPAIMRHDKRFKSFFNSTSALLTIHNGGIIYQQNILDRKETEDLTGLPENILKFFKMEYGYSPLLTSGKYGFLNTVSPQYAREILSGSDENSGVLGTVLKENNIELCGITNGIDIALYKKSQLRDLPDPIPGSTNLDWKKHYKASMFDRIEEFRDEVYLYGSLIRDPEIPLITMQSRITYQKGIDILIDSIESLINSGTEVNVMVIGEGEPVYEEKLAKLADGRNNICYIRKYCHKLSKLLFGAGDFFLIPSRWEPCGLTDFISQLNGNLPIVHETGGLVKTSDMINGFSYGENRADLLVQKIHQALGLYKSHSKVLFNMRNNAVNIINEKYTWKKVLAEGYIPLYRKIFQHIPRPKSCIKE